MQTLLFRLKAAPVLLLSLILLWFSPLLLAQHTSDSLQGSIIPERILMQDAQQGFVQDALQAMSGKVAGLSIIRRGSDPNVPGKLLMRGIQHNFSDGPLYIVDGVWDAEVDDLHPDEIESIEVLKDAAATARYGSRGMDGVILIQTRKPGADKPFRLDFRTSLGLQMAAKKMDLLTASDIRKLIEDNEQFAEADQGASIDWQDEIFRNSLTRDYFLSASGTLRSTGYRISIDRRDLPGIVEGSDRQQSGASFRLEQSALNKRLKIRAGSGMKHIVSHSIPDYSGQKQNNVFYQAFIRNPTEPVFESDGSTYFQQSGLFAYNNPLAILEYSGNEIKTNTFRSFLQADLSLLENLSLHFSGGHSLTKAEGHRWQSAEAVMFGVDEEGGYERDRERLNAGAGLLWQPISGKHHHLGISLNYNHRLQLHKSTDWEHNENDQRIEGDTYYKYLFHSTQLGASYDYRKRFFVSLGVNYENYALRTNLPKVYTPEILRNNEWYPSLTGGWRIYDSSRKEKKTKLSQLSVRAAYGQSGNSNLHLITEGDAYFPDLEETQTERMEEFSAGIAFGFLDDRISGSLVAYSRTNGKAYGKLPAPVPPHLFSYFYSNAYSFENKGIEISIGGLILKGRKMEWHSTLVGHYNHNKLSGGLGENQWQEGFIDPYYIFSDSYTQVLGNGSPARQFYLPLFAGYDENGFTLFYDQDGKVVNNAVIAGRIKMGRIVPAQEIGWQHHFLFTGGFEVDMCLRFVDGHYLYNASRMVLSEPAYPGTYNMTREGLENFEQGVVQTEISDFFLEKATYVRLEHLRFSYHFQASLAGRDTGVRLWLSGGNLLTISKYKGLDPAYDLGGVEAFNVYPLARSFSLGLHLIM